MMKKALKQLVNASTAAYRAWYDNSPDLTQKLIDLNKAIKEWQKIGGS